MKKLLIAIIGASCVAIAALVYIGFPMLFVMLEHYDQQVNGQAADKTQRRMEIEFQKISPLPFAMPVQDGSMGKTHQGIVSTAYKTNLGYGDLKTHYDKELGNGGWRFVREAEVIYDGQDYGGKELFYCKGNYTADLQFAGRQEKEFGWTYSFALTWGLSNECK